MEHTAVNGLDDPMTQVSLRLIEGHKRPMVQGGQLIADRDYYAHSHFKNMRLELGTDESVNAVAMLGKGRVCSLALHRALGEGRFSEFELNLLGVFWDEVSTLIGWPGRPVGGWLKTKNGDLLDLRGLDSSESFEVIAEHIGLTRREREVAA